MNFTFKLARRLARFRAALLLAPILFTLSCSASDDLNGPITDNTASASPSELSASNWNFRKRWKLVTVTVSPAATTLRPGATQTFSATATGSNGNPIKLDLQWSATGGSLDTAGRYTAGQTPGTYVVIASSTLGVSDTARVVISTDAPSSPAPATSQVVLSPAAATVAVGDTADFSAVGKASDGSTVAITPTYAASAGTISPSGKYTAPKTAGKYRITATDATSGKADTSEVTVTTTTPVVAQVVLSPGTASLAPGGTKQFSATGQASDGSAVTITPKYSATGGNISNDGLYTAGQTAGTFRVIASDTASGKADTATVTVTAPTPTLQSLVVTPASASLASGGTQQFAATGKMSDGSSTSVTVTWTANGGTISSAGLYTAGSTTGNYRVIAAGNGKADTAAVTITAPTTPPPTTGGCDVDKSALMFYSSFENGAPASNRVINGTDTWDGFWIGQVGAASYNLQKVTTPENECGSAARIELRRSDPIIAGSNRAQIMVSQSGYSNGGVPVPSNKTVAGGLGDERWFGFSVFIPSSWTFESSWAPETIFEVISGARSPFFEISIDRGNWVIVNRSGRGPQNDPSWVTSAFNTPIERGQWTNFVVHAKWSGSGDGVLQVWKNGAKVVDRANTATAFSDAGDYAKPCWGIYKWSWSGQTSGGSSIVSERDLALDNIRVTDGAHGSFAVVSPR